MALAIKLDPITVRSMAPTLYFMAVSVRATKLAHNVFLARIPVMQVTCLIPAFQIAPVSYRGNPKNKPKQE